MPTTRRQTARNTRSSGPASILTGLGTSTGVKKRRTKAKSKTTVNPKPSPPRNEPDNEGKIHRILWHLVKIYSPCAKIILKPFKRSNRTVVSIIIVAIFLSSVLWSFRREITGYVLPVSVTAVLPSVYFIDMSGPLSNDLSKPCHVTEYTKRWFIGMLVSHSRINVFRIKGSGSPGLGRQLGICLHVNDSVKQSKQDQPVDIITINAFNVTSVALEIFDAILALCDGSSKGVDYLRQVKEELDLKRDLFPSESNIFKTDNVVKVLLRKLDELFKRRKSYVVMIFYNWEDQKDIPVLLGYSEPEISTNDLSVDKW